MTDVNPIASLFPGQVMQLRLMVLLAYVLLAVGLVAPVITLEKFVLIENTFSVISGIYQLLLEERWFLFVIIGGFSVLLPVLKLYVLHRLLGRHCRNAERLRHYLHWMHLYGKWSMLDVFIVAVLVVAVKLGAVAQVEMRYGLYAFAASVLLTMFITARVVVLADRVESAAGVETRRQG
ncbi:MAG: paraquat-inducible protein A [Thiogranum sp.]|nr:paraquat-inducible protein A [Thiogranum sp.]